MKGVNKGREGGGEGWWWDNISLLPVSYFYRKDIAAAG